MDLFGLLGLIYILVLGISLVTVVILIVLKWQKTIGFSKENMLLLFLALVTMATSWSYFIIDFYSIILNIEQIPAVIRVLDIWLTLATPFIWFVFIAEKLFGQMKKRVRTGLVMLGIGGMVITFVNYGLLLNGYYKIKSLRAENFLFTTEDLTAVIITVICIMVFVCILKERTSLEFEKSELQFVIVGTFLVLFDGIQSFSIDFAVLTKELYLAPIVKAAFAVMLMWYVIKRFLLEQYQKHPKEIMSADQILEMIAGECSLTSQELVVAKLLYSGSTYKDIGEYLFISVHTVRRHASNIYNKINVSSKMELIQLVRGKIEE